MNRELTDYIVIHCAATKSDQDINAATIDAWHRDLGWKGIGYHCVVKRDGTVEDGRDLKMVGAHVKGFNSVSVGVCLAGGIDDRGEPIYNFTKEQMTSLAVLVSGLRREYPQARIVGHRDLDSGKACPCFDVGLWARENLF